MEVGARYDGIGMWINLSNVVVVLQQGHGHGIDFRSRIFWNGEIHSRKIQKQIFKKIYISILFKK